MNPREPMPEPDERAWFDQSALVALCPYCGNTQPTDVINANGECPTVVCCGERHCIAYDPSEDGDDERF